MLNNVFKQERIQEFQKTGARKLCTQRTFRAVKPYVP